MKATNKPCAAHLADVLAPDPGRPVTDGEEVLGVERIALERIHRAVMGVVCEADLLGHRLAFAVARHYQALLRADLRGSIKTNQ